MRTAWTVLPAAILAAGAVTARAEDAFLDRVLEQARTRIKQLPDYVCAQTLERAERGPREETFKLKDRLHLEVTSIGGKERFAKADSSRFDDRELREMVTRGVVATGGYALFLKHVVQPGSAAFRDGADAAIDGRRVRRYEFHVPLERSGYTIAVPPHQARAPFHGSLMADADSGEVVRLEIIADEIPPELGFDRTQTVLNYRPVRVGDAEFPFAASSESVAVAMDGNEYRNRAELGQCRRYAAESKLTFAGEEIAAPAQNARPAAPKERKLAAASLVEVELEEPIDLASAAPDSLFRARLAEPLKSGDTVIAPAGAPVYGTLLELERVGRPVDRYEVVLRIDALEVPESGERITLAAKLRDTGGAPGLIKQEKRFMPVFEKRRANRFSVLVRETGADYAVLYWDARKPQIKKGFRMRWITEGAAEEEK